MGSFIWPSWLQHLERSFFASSGDRSGLPTAWKWEMGYIATGQPFYEALCPRPDGLGVNPLDAKDTT